MNQRILQPKDLKILATLLRNKKTTNFLELIELDIFKNKEPYNIFAEGYRKIAKENDINLDEFDEKVQQWWHIDNYGTLELLENKNTINNVKSIPFWYWLGEATVTLTPDELTKYRNMVKEKGKNRGNTGIEIRELVCERIFEKKEICELFDSINKFEKYIDDCSNSAVNNN